MWTKNSQTMGGKCLKNSGVFLTYTVHIDETPAAAVSADMGTLAFGVSGLRARS